MLGSAHRQIVPSSKGLLTRLAYAAAEGKGVDLESLLQKSGLSHKQVHDPNARVEVRKQIRFLNLVSEAIGDDQGEYNDCRATLLADGKCTTGGGAAPVYFLELVGNLMLIDVKGGTVVAVTGLPPSTPYLIRYLDAVVGGGK